MTKKIFAMFLAVLMVVSMLPTSVFAAEGECPGKGNDQHNLNNCDWTVVKVTDPTCYVDGHTSYKCNECGYIFAGSVVPATGEHNWVPSEGQAPTCGAWGWEGGMECATEGCPATKDTTPLAPLFKEGTDCEWVDLTPNINCETGGQKEYECAACGATKKGEEYEPGEHAWAKCDPQLVTPATEETPGLAIIYCFNCDATKEVVVFASHDCEKYFVEEVKPTCTTDGMGAHWKCRVCDAIYLKESHYYPADEDQIEEKLLEPYKGGHTYAHPAYGCICAGEPSHTATCIDTVLFCTVCEKAVEVNVEHEVDWKATGWQKDSADLNDDYVKVAATCTTSGYEADWCNVCRKFRDVRVLEAKGHDVVTVTVPATCGSYAYTFSYCDRDECVLPAVETVKDKFGIVYSTAVPGVDQIYDLGTLQLLSSWGLGFYMAVGQNKLGDTLYLNGKMDGYYLATTSDISEAVAIYVEALENYRDFYYLYFYNEEGVKTYLSIAQVGSYVNAVLSTEVPATYFTYENGTFVTEIYGSDKWDTWSTKYYLGTYKSYTTVGPYKMSTFDSRFPAFPYTNLFSASGAKLIGEVVFDYESKFDAENHYWELESSEDPTCKNDGYETYVCRYCLKTQTVTLPKEHVFVDLTGDVTIGSKTIPAYVPATCVDGYQYQQCACGELNKKVLPGYGHHMTESIHVAPNHMSLVGYYATGCAYCDYEVKTYTYTWQGTGYYFDTKADAMAAHGGCDLTEETKVRNGDCETVGLYRYTCSGCGKYVYVKQWLDVKDADGNVIASYITGQHIAPSDKVYHQEPTCEDAGFHITYECVRCQKIIGNKGLGEVEELKATGHNLIPSANVGYTYVPADCDSPDYWNYKYYCTKCGTMVNDGTKWLCNGDWFKAGCEWVSYEYYMCHCGEEHIRDFIVYEHNYIELPKVSAGDKRADGTTVSADEVTYQAPTCYAEGWQLVKCEYCGDVQKDVIAKVEHVNAAGNKFTDKCTDTETDRHCVVCCDHYEHDKKGNKHDCYAKNDDGDFICEGECIIPTYCHWIVAEKRPSTCTMDAHTLYVCPDCTGEKVVAAEVNKNIKENGTALYGIWNEALQEYVPTTFTYFYGHRPENAWEVEYVENADGLLVPTGAYTEQYFGNYQYVNIAYQWVEVVGEGENARFVRYMSLYTAKFVEYKAPTYTEEGYAKMYCEHCDKVVEQIIPKLTGISFEFDIQNANGTGNDYTYGSLVEVTVSINGNEDGIYGFNFDVYGYPGMRYVGYKTLNEDVFNLTVTEPENSYSWLTVAGKSSHTATGKMQNTTITGKTELLKLYFRVARNYNEDVKATFGFTNAYAEKLENAVATKPVAMEANWFEKEILVREFMDFDKNGEPAYTDLNLAVSLLTGEHPEGKTYDVTVDMNKDGVITLEDLSIAYNLKVGNYTQHEVFLMGIPTEEAVEFWGLDQHDYCYSCGAKLAEAATFCSDCGLKQPTE